MCLSAYVPEQQQDGLPCGAVTQALRNSGT